MTTPSIPPETPSENAPPARRGLPLQQIWRRVSLSNLQILVVILLVIGGRLVIDFGQRIIEGQNKVTQQRELEDRIRELQIQQQKLEADKAYFSSTAFVEAWAHSDGKMVRPGEKIVIPLYKGQPRPKQQPNPTQTATPIPNWATWWTLFFDSPPPLGQTENTSSAP